jgi:hypothetical protein
MEFINLCDADICAIKKTAEKLVDITSTKNVFAHLKFFHTDQIEPVDLSGVAVCDIVIVSEDISVLTYYANLKFQILPMPLRPEFIQQVLKIIIASPCFSITTQNIMSPGSKHLVLRNENDYRTVESAQIVFFTLDQREVEAVTADNELLYSSKSLKEVKDLLPAYDFFRINKQIIINKKYIDGFKVVDQIRLHVSLQWGGHQKVFVIGQDRATEFRKWIGLKEY